jgi:hypothetical protein
VAADIIRYIPKLNSDKYILVNLPLILNKLCRDGYLDARQMPMKGYDNTITAYSINFEGKFFSQSGGYGQKFRARDERKRWDDNLLLKGEKNAERLNFYTLILGIGTLLLVLIEVVKFYHDIGSQSP